jgi:hypothetical protein
MTQRKLGQTIGMSRFRRQSRDAAALDGQPNRYLDGSDVISDTAESLCPAHLRLHSGLSSPRYDLHQGLSWQQPVRGLLRDHLDCGKDVVETVAPEA